MLIMMGYFVTQVLGGFSNVYAYQHLSTTVYAAIDNFNTVFAFLIGYFVLKENISINKIIGCVLMFAGVGLNLYTRIKTKQKLTLKPFFKKMLLD